MSRRSEEQTNRDQSKPASGEIYHNGRWISVEDCQTPYTQQQQQPPAPAGRWSYDEDGRQVWSEDNGY